MSLQNGIVVRGQQHYWVHRLRLGLSVAGVGIDRFTGKVIDKQIEVMNE